MLRRSALVAALAALSAAAGLAGCASLNSVAIDVSSQGDWPADRKPGSYAIERLPSQQANAGEQERVEAAALPSIEGAGFSPAPLEQADFLIQVGARVFEVPGRPSYYGYGYYGSPFYWRHDWWMYGYRHPFFYGPGFYGDGFPDYRRETAILIRDRRSQRIVYETRAAHVGGWTSDRLLPLLFDASMKDFPMPALSPRTVTMPLPPGS